MVERVTKCDGCGAIKGPANHWFIGWLSTVGTYGVGRWDQLRFDSDRDHCEHFCGRACLDKRVNAHLEAKP